MAIVFTPAAKRVISTFGPRSTNGIKNDLSFSSVAADSAAGHTRPARSIHVRQLGFTSTTINGTVSAAAPPLGVCRVSFRGLVNKGCRFSTRTAQKTVSHCTGMSVRCTLDSAMAMT